MDIAGLLGLLGNAESEQHTSQAPVSGLLGELAGGVGKKIKKGATNPMGLLGDLAASMQENMPLPSTESLRSGQFFVTGSDQDKWIDAAPGMAGAIKAIKPTKFEIAHQVAQINAALPIEQGGLGLHPNNTAMERARALGFVDDAYHGTTGNIKAFNPSLSDTRRKTGTPDGSFAVSSNPKTANTYAGAIESINGGIIGHEKGASVYPLMVNKGKNKSFNADGAYWNDLYDQKTKDTFTVNDFAQRAKDAGKDSATIKKVYDLAAWVPQRDRLAHRGETTFIFDPSNIRSRFAAFDPMRRNEADLLGAASPELLAYISAAGLLGAGGYKMAQDK